MTSSGKLVVSLSTREGIFRQICQPICEQYAHFTRLMNVSYTVKSGNCSLAGMLFGASEQLRCRLWYSAMKLSETKTEK